MTEGFLWFHDLTSPDPLGILPLMGAGITFLNLMNSQVTSNNETMRKIRRYMFVLPLISGPVWMTFPVAFNLYWLVSSGTQLAVLTAFRTERFRNWMGIPDYLPGSKLERMQSNYIREEARKMKKENVKIYSSKPKNISTKKKAQQVSEG